ncbi:unnamed protein product [Kuraishia capsulata CBS 1993]|uniref:Cysteine protease RIM13 n=1 Tax=Kuraishia capsulata CBS 1993 TaxID=1382522 RepID=W6MJ04_9ASCO|nr:uncharacterized protein KUCA_T00002147001 [Kuraishia capsulata CBS 1993]CDK26176.1 unnamed protein product [Kuraishia capsulata CBS 1993]
MELEIIHNLYEFANFNRSLGNHDEFDILFKRCYRHLKEELDRRESSPKESSPEFKNDLIQLTKKVLELKETQLTMQEKLIWLGSKIGGRGGFWFPSDRFYFVDSPELGCDTSNQRDLVFHEDVPDTKKEGDLRGQVHQEQEHQQALESINGLRLDKTEDNTPDIDWSLEGFETLRQNGSDCSFVSSLISMMSSGFDISDLITKGKHRFGVTFHLNGCTRYVVVDSFIPELSVKSRNKKLLWPAIVEKAYTKLFEGSNFANDMYLLSGWIPEYVPIRYLTRERRLEIYEMFKKNEVRIGLGTFDESHDFAIVNIEIEPDASDVVFTVVDPRESYNGKFKLKSLNDYEVLYVCHNPLRFSFITQQILMNTNTREVWSKPQFTVQCDEATTIWCLMERFLTGKNASTPKEGSINVHWKHGKDRIYSLSNCARGTANNSRFHLSKFAAQKGHSTLCVDSDIRSIVSLTLYSTSKISLCKAKDEKSTEVIRSSWSLSNSGGSYLHPTFCENPTYELIVPDNSRVDIALESCHEAEVTVFKEEISDKNMVYSPTYSRNVYHEDVLLLGTRFILVPSTYDPGQTGGFSMAIRHDSGIKLRELSTRLGLFVKTERGDNFPRFALTTSRRSSMRIRARLSETNTNTMTITQFRNRNDTETTASSHLPNNGEFHLQDAFHGSEFELHLEGHYLIDFPLISSQLCAATVEVGSDHPFELQIL